jgi:IclR family transcriptional regulator, KDG regulon repressor
VTPSQPVPQPDMILGTLDKGLRVLDALAADESPGGLTLTELALRLDMHRTTLFRMLATLRARGYVSRDRHTDRYCLGTQVLALATSLLDGLDTHGVAKPHLVALRDRTQELVNLTVLDDDHVVTLERVEGRHPISLQTDIGARRPVYCSAAGKAILAYLPAEEVDRILALGMPSVTPTTITRSDDMKAHLDDVRQRGYSWDNEERIDGVRCVAAAVLGHDGSVRGAVSIAAPTLRMPWERVWPLGEEVKATADAISRELGYRERHGPGRSEDPKAVAIVDNHARED